MVVGTVHSEASLAAALALAPLPAAPDLLEWRVDHFTDNPAALEALAGSAGRPFILTVRHPGEGGAGALSPAARRGLYERFLPSAHFVDLELATLPDLPSVAAAARGLAGGLILSYHDFAGTPALGELVNLAGRAADAGAAIFKIAVRVERASQLATLGELLERETRLPLAVMGMGPLGRISRLLAGALGSRLNYGYLGAEAQVPGQWPAAVLRARLDELSSG